MMEILKSPAERREGWYLVVSFIFIEALRRPWRWTRWKAFIQASEYAKMDDPPVGWPDDILPTSWPGW